MDADLRDELVATLSEVRRAAETLRNELGRPRLETGLAELADADREQLRGRCESLPDAEVVWLLLSTLKITEHHARLNSSTALTMAQMSQVALGEVLTRFLPVDAFARAFAIYEGDAEPVTPPVLALVTGGADA